MVRKSFIGRLLRDRKGQGLVEYALLVAGIALVAPADSDLVKAQKLYAAVEALDNTDYSRKKSTSELKQSKQKEAKRNEDTWTQKRATARDRAALPCHVAGLGTYRIAI